MFPLVVLTSLSSPSSLETFSASIFAPLTTPQLVSIIVIGILILFVGLMTGLLAKTPYLINNYPTTLTFILKDLLQIWGQVKMIAFAYKSMIFKTTVADIFEKQVRTHGKSTFLIQNDDYWSYHETNQAINRIAHLLLSHLPHLKQGSTICLMMENVPEYIITWHAILKLGCVGALLNIHIGPKQLAHCINTADPVLIITDQPHLSLLLQLQEDNKDSAFSTAPIVVLEPMKVSPWLLMDEVDVVDVCDVISQQGFTSSKGNNFVDRSILPSSLGNSHDDSLFKKDGMVSMTDNTKPIPNSLQMAQKKTTSTHSPQASSHLSNISRINRQSVLYNALSQYLSSSSLARLPQTSDKIHPTTSTTTTTTTTHNANTSKIQTELLQSHSIISTEERGDHHTTSDISTTSQPIIKSTTNSTPLNDTNDSNPNDKKSTSNTPINSTAQPNPTSNAIPDAPSPTHVIFLDTLIKDKLVPFCAELLTKTSSSPHKRIIHYTNSIVAPSKDTSFANHHKGEQMHDTNRHSSTIVVRTTPKGSKNDRNNPNDPNDQNGENNGQNNQNIEQVSQTTIIKNPFFPSLPLITRFFSSSSLSHENPPAALRSESDYMSTGLLIYTSGTTGMPKAAILRNSRIISSGDVFIQNFGIKSADRLYTVLPLYHSAGGVCSSYAAVLTGASLVIKKKLSTRDFWKDCHHYQVTIIQYIGELCRYLLNTSATSHPGYDASFEKKHCIRMAFGNGLRSDVWLGFQERFNIPNIAEFYASTEGNVALFCLYNRENRYHATTLHPFQEMITNKPIESIQEPQQEGENPQQNPQQNQQDNSQNQLHLPSHPTLKSLLQATSADSKYGFGSVGHNGPLTKFLSGFSLVKYDIENDIIIKNPKTGFAIECDYNEPGLLVAPIINWDPVRRYGGYYRKGNVGTTTTNTTNNDISITTNNNNMSTTNNNNNSPKSNLPPSSPPPDGKILSGLFRKNDQYFNTGDILTLDQYGYWRFSDRIGDTFRWKSENVSTQEVEAICSAYTQVAYGGDGICSNNNTATTTTTTTTTNNNNNDGNNNDIDDEDVENNKPPTTTTTNSIPSNKPTAVFETINSYGIEIPGQDGRCCMVAVTLLPPFIAPNDTKMSHNIPSGTETANEAKKSNDATTNGIKNDSKILISSPDAHNAHNNTHFTSLNDYNIPHDPNSFDFKAFYQFCNRSFSAFSQPAFIRFIAPENKDNTGTFKLKKAVLRQQGAKFYVDGGAGIEGDVVYGVRHDLKTFVELDKELWERYIAQTARL